MTSYIEELRKFTLQLKLIEDEAWSDFTSIWQKFEVEKGQSITNVGEVERYLYFTCEGIQRVYYIDDTLKEATLVLTYPYSFAGVVDSFLLQQPSKYTFEAISKSVFLRASHQQLKSVMAQHESISELIQYASHLAFSGLLERMVDLQLKRSEDKFKTLLRRSPHVLQVVPHKYLANYLGIDPTNFSKLINSVNF